MITGDASPVKLKAGVRHDFVIHLAGGVDLGKYKLYAYRHVGDKASSFQDSNLRLLGPELGAIYQNAALI